ncbi:MAG: DUF5678 domain-containing protein [Methanosarcinales archaeon]
MEEKETKKIFFESKEFIEDMKWAEQNYSKLQEQFADKWIAVVDKKVVAAGESLNNVEWEAEQKTHKNRKYIPVIFIESGNYVF